MDAPQARFRGFIRFTIVPLLAVALVGFGLHDETMPAATSGQPTNPAPVNTSKSGPSATVTLITGDRVTVRPQRTGQPIVLVDPRGGAGNNHGFRVVRQGDNIHVIPSDVAALVPGVLDPSLFDVSSLIDMGYDDAHRADLPLIVRTETNTRRLGDAAPAITAVRRLDSVGALAGVMTKTNAVELGHDLVTLAAGDTRQASAALGGVRQIRLDRRVQASAVDRYLRQVKAPEAWQRGLDGGGVTVAVLDTGVDDGHPALAGQVTAHANFTDEDSSADGHGHGTHVASLVAGTGARSDGARRGIAPEAALMSGKVLDDEGFGQESWVIDGMEWAAEEGAEIVNLSLGGPAGDTDDMLVKSLEKLTRRTGTMFVVAAGNQGGLGDSPFTIESPGTAASALTVGAVTDTDALAYFSSQGPTTGSYRLKPDVAAPGVEVMGARAGARGGDFYVPMTGTSQATPIVAGAAALVMQQHPNWSWSDVKARLVTTADPYRYQTSWSHGGGRLDLEQATVPGLTSSLAGLDFGYFRHPDEKRRVRSLTLSNPGDAPVNVTLTDELSNADGHTAPDRALTASPSTLTVPAGGSASASIVVDPDLLDDSLWQGSLTVDSRGQTVLRLPIGFYDEPERYDVTLHVVDRAGNPNSGGEVAMFEGDTGFFYRVPLDDAGTATVRVAPGHYSIFARITTPAHGDTPETFTVAGSGEVAVEHDLTYDIDARDAIRLDAPTIRHRPTRATEILLHWSRFTDDGQGYTDFAGFDPQEIADGRVFITPTAPVTHGRFEAGLRWRLEPTIKKQRGPDAYELVLATPNFTNPLSPELDRRDVADMALIDGSFRAISKPGQYVVGRAYYTDLSGVALITRRPLQTPTRRLERLTATSNVYWYRCLQVPARPIAELCPSLAQSYSEGERVHERFADGLHPDVYQSWHVPDSLFVEVGIGDGQHTGQLDFNAVADARLSLYRDGKFIGAWDDVFGHFPVPNKGARFRLEQDVSLKQSAIPVARTARTVWKFDSAPPDDPNNEGATVPPILTIDYDADVDQLGRALPRRPLSLTVRVGHVAGSTAAPIEDSRLWYSRDHGDTWKRLRVKDLADGEFRAVIPGRAVQPGDGLSLRAAAVDAAGGQIDQRVLGIIPVRRGS